ncbi:MAG TPA: hypothetical protein DIT64_19280 [Verrucomicrobiales bacterium]|nr:hypothetical protein [Verrucomicrobiales bacterium]
MNIRPLILAFCLPVFAGAADHAAWTHRQTVRVTQPGLTRIELDPALLDASRAASFHDLRLVSPDGVETPRIIALPRVVRPERVEAVGFKAMLAGAATVLEFQPRERDTIKEIVLRTSSVDFIKAAKVEASSDGGTWQTLGSGEVLCRQNGTERLRLPLAPGLWTHFRVTLDDMRSAPVAFTGAEIVRELPELRSIPHAVEIRSRMEEDGRTKLTLDLGTANVLLATVRVLTPEPVFQREAELLSARATLFRLKHEDFTGEEIEIPVHRAAPAREIVLTLHNGDSPPLRVEGIEAARHAVPLVFQAGAAGDWQLYIGNAQAAEPRYDIGALGDKLRDASATTATAGKVEANPDFRAAATAPVVGEVGSALDVSAWSYQREVLFAAPGVIEVELDPAVLARSAGDLHDLRVVRDGRQIPFLVTRPDEKREITLTFSEIHDPKAPAWSKWEIEMPLPNFPVSELLLDSSTPLFSRSLILTEDAGGAQGRQQRVLGSAAWQRKPGDAARAFRLPLRVSPRAGVLTLATDNGDNAPLRLDSVRASHPVVRLLFRVPDTEPARLCYGNPRAAYARYDLDLVRREFEAAVKVPATLGEEEKLPGHREERGVSGNGSPWLWGALALVVGALLWIVAGMLPRQQA